MQRHGSRPYKKPLGYAYMWKISATVVAWQRRLLIRELEDALPNNARTAAGLPGVVAS
jgi:hypothetical protein